MPNTPTPIPAPHEVCGACGHFEPARYEPTPPKYGYCASHLVTGERGLHQSARLVDVAAPCFVRADDSASGRVAFTFKKDAS